MKANTNDRIVVFEEDEDLLCFHWTWERTKYYSSFIPQSASQINQVINEGNVLSK